MPTTDRAQDPPRTIRQITTRSGQALTISTARTMAKTIVTTATMTSPTGKRTMTQMTLPRLPPTITKTLPLLVTTPMSTPDLYKTQTRTLKDLRRTSFGLLISCRFGAKRLERPGHFAPSHTTSDR